MRFIALFIAALLVACGSNIRDKEPNSSTSPNSKTEPNNTTSTNAVSNAATNAGTSTNNASNGTSSNSATNATTNAAMCDILTSDSAEDYCNLQATCGEQSLLVECIMEGGWLCYCGMEAIEVDQNPCDDPDAYAPQFATACDTGSNATMSACQSSGFDNGEFDCSYGVTCADEHEYAVACDSDTEAETSACQCYVDGEPTESFTADGLTCRVGNDDLSWWNDGCGWALSRD